MDEPFSTLRTHLKFIRPDRLDAVQTAAMTFAFAAFFADEPVNVKGREQVRSIRPEVTGDEAPFGYRRFSGGVQLPRGRYFTLSGHDGDDGYALESEVRAYVDHARAGRVHIYDGLSRRIALKGRGDVQWTSADQVIRLRFQDVPGYPSPFITWMSDNAYIAERSDATVDLPYRVQEAEISSVIDLRLPSTQRWLYENVINGLPGVAYYYLPNNLVPGLVIRGERPKESILRDSMKDHGSHSLVWYPDNATWDRSVWDGTDDFLGLLPFLIFPGRGGSPITEAIGRWLQQIGANGLVFPSCRTNVMCMVDADETITESWGWNFVDYRDAPAPTPASWIIIGPDSWWGMGQKTDVRRFDDGRSWMIIGTSQSHLDHFEASQRRLSGT